MENAISKLRIYIDVTSQLRSKNSVRVIGNPVSVVPMFAYQVLFTLGWGGTGDITRIMSHENATYPMDKATIEIDLSIMHIDGSRNDITLNVEWTYSGAQMTVKYSYDGTQKIGRSFLIGNEQGQFVGANNSLKEAIIDVINAYA